MRISLILLIGTIFLISNAQESVRFASYNSQLVIKNKPFASKSTVSNNLDTLQLPFFDDFSRNFVFPDSTLWIDRHAYINNSFPINPPTLGVATLDGLNELGLPHGGTSNDTADFLTSCPINLDNLQDSNIILSFYYQPGGNGDLPEPEDVLFLQFKDSSKKWQTVWSRSDSMLSDFKFVAIPIDTNIYCHKSFQFRLGNIATLSGNLDHWHIDYIYIDKDRSIIDSTFNDIAITNTPSSMLSNYTAMPWRQFKGFETQELKTQLPLHIKSLHPIVGSTDINYQISFTETVTDTLIESIPTTSTTIPYGTSINESYSLNPLLTKLQGNISETFNEDSVRIQAQCIIGDTSIANRPPNDTCIFEQPFYNYLAYDDGSSEKVYGINGVASYERFVAYKFSLNRTDTLRAVQFHFSHFIQKRDNMLFNIIIWKTIDQNNTGSGDVILHREDFKRPQFTEMVNGFSHYTLFPDEPIVLDGDFYIGWGQTDNRSLDVGFDIHSDNSSKLYFNTDGNWNQSGQTGTLMLRPVLGKPVLIASNDPLTTHNTNKIEYYPNPTDDVLYLLKSGLEITITNLSGQMVLKEQDGSKSIFTDQLKNGIYLLTLHDKQNRKTQHSKLIIQH